MPDTHVYKRVGDCEIRLDVYPAHGTTPAPVIVIPHGGGLIVGSRKEVASEGPALLHELCTAAGYTQVAINYRLAPETKLPAILEDLDDAWRWIHDEVPKRYNVDQGRVAILGRSAGGYLALVGGHRLTPRPSALVSFYGYGDIVQPWYTRPNEHYCRTHAMVSEAEARAAVGTAPVTESGDMEPPRGDFYYYVRQQGRWLEETVGLDPSDPALHAYCPARHVDAAYPPTLLLHGTRDTDVPYEASTQMHAALQAKGVVSKLVTIPDGDHVFDFPLTRADLIAASPTAAAASLSEVMSFLDQHLR